MEVLNLHQWQNQFKQWLQLEELGLDHLQAIAAHVAGEGESELKNGRSSRRRVEAYRYAYRARLIESMIDDFPRLVSRLGEEKFRTIATRYLASVPSRYDSVGDFSFPFPEFLRSENAHESSALAAFELDLLRVERSLVDPQWRTEDAPVEGPVPFLVNPSLLIREYDYRVEESDESEAAEADPDLKAQLTRESVTIALYATDSVEWLVLEPDSVSILNELKAELDSAGLDELLERWTARQVDPDKLQEWITDWVKYGILIASPSSSATPTAS